MNSRITVTEFQKLEFEILLQLKLFSHSECKLTYFELINEEQDLFMALTVTEIEGKRRQYHVAYKNFDLATTKGTYFQNWEGFVYEMLDKVLNIKS